MTAVIYEASRKYLAYMISALEANIFLWNYIRYDDRNVELKFINSIPETCQKVLCER